MSETKRKCPCCNNYAPNRLVKVKTQYYECDTCKTVFSDPLDNSDMVGGGAEPERNLLQNPERIMRLKILAGGNIEGINVLDFGCGFGKLVNDLNAAGFVAEGYDAYNEDFLTLPKRNYYHAVTMIEVIEHLSAPFVELDCIHRSLVKGGIVYIETSFTDVAKQENIELENFEYLNPSVGHSTVFSHWGLDVLMAIKGFIPTTHINRHVRIYIKK